MVTLPFFLLTALMWLLLRPTHAWVVSPGLSRGVTVAARVSTPRTVYRAASSSSALSSAASSSTSTVSFDKTLSRKSTLQTLLSQHGAPGSIGCRNPNKDLFPVESLHDKNTPELVASLSGGENDEELANLHPYLYPIAKSTSSGNYICAYRNPFVEDSEPNHPWPIVETTVRSVKQGPAGPGGIKLLALNSEHLMRRIVAECDDNDNDNDNIDTINLYNEPLGKGLLYDKALDTPYQPGSVKQLGYGVDKYVLLRVGPFPDLYEKMSQQHASRGDEPSSLIAAEAANSKLAGFGSNFLFYAQMLRTFPGRHEEARDAARMCLRLPLPTIGLDRNDLTQVAILGQMMTTTISDDDNADTTQLALAKLGEFYEKMREVEKDDDPSQQGKSPQQIAMDKANHLIDMCFLQGKEWSSIRPQLGELFRSAGMDDFSSFVELK